MLDAELSEPICGDTYAKLFMSREGLEVLDQFKELVLANTLNVARPRIIDDMLRHELQVNPDSLIVLVGAGFDSRAYRMQGGIWVELDEPQVIELKNELLPESACNNSLRRIPISFLTESLEEKLKPFTSDRPVIVVIEGVLMYLNETSIEKTLFLLQKVFPKHKLICDLMSDRFFVKYAQPIHKKFEALGARFSFTISKPEQLVVRNGYRKTTVVSIARKAVEYNSLKIPKLLLNVFMTTLRTGYSVNVFEKM